MGTRRRSNVDSVEVTQVVIVRSVVGQGHGADPMRQVIEIFSMEGELLARHDTREDNLDPIEHYDDPFTKVMRKNAD